jgi:YHS domain-containing protein
MIKFLILLAVGYLLYRSMKNWMFPDVRKKKTVSSRANGQIDDIMIKDPICEAYFPRRDAVSLKIEGNVYYFCSKACRDKYIARHSDET